MLFDLIRQEILNQVRFAYSELPKETLADLPLETPPDPKMGDFALPTFKLSKALRKAPPVIAKELAEKLQVNAAITFFCKVSIAGPYVNFAVKKDTLLGSTLEALLLSREKLGHQVRDQKEKVVLEFSSPNIAKPFNIYHLRGTMIGSSLYKIYEARGYECIAINHLGDWGTQFGTLALAYEMWGNDAELESRKISYLVELYVRINKEIETNPSLGDKSREYFSRLEKGDVKIKALWEKFIELSLREFRNTYERLNVHFDHYWGESFYLDKIPAIEKTLRDKRLIVESEGAQVVLLEQWNMPPCIFRKQDGSTIYATRDLAAALFRFQKFHFSKMVYVVGGEQKLHFSQLFKTLELAGCEWVKNCVHIDYGLYRFNDAKMSTRKGNFVTMESVLDQAVERVQKIMEEKNTIPTKEEREKAAEAIGVGAVIFNDLSTDRNNDVNFDLDRVLDFEGETGPYIQYAHTRCLGIVRNAPENLLEDIHIGNLLDLSAEQPGFRKLCEDAAKALREEEELLLIRTLAKLPFILDLVLENSKPHLLANYLIDVTKAFNTFYRAHKVLVEDKKLARARLGLIIATQRTLLKGLSLLGMKAPERM